MKNTPIRKLKTLIRHEQSDAKKRLLGKVSDAKPVHWRNQSLGEIWLIDHAGDVIECYQPWDGTRAMIDEHKQDPDVAEIAICGAISDGNCACIQDGPHKFGPPAHSFGWSVDVWRRTN